MHEILMHYAREIRGRIKREVVALLHRSPSIARVLGLLLRYTTLSNSASNASPNGTFGTGNFPTEKQCVPVVMHWNSAILMLVPTNIILVVELDCSRLSSTWSTSDQHDMLAVPAAVDNQYSTPPLPLDSLGYLLGKLDWYP